MITRRASRVGVLLGVPEEGYLALRLCALCGSATYRVDLSNSRLPSPVLRRSASKRPTETSELRPQNSMRWQRNSDRPWTSLRSRNARGPKSWQPSPLTKRKSQRATSQHPGKPMCSRFSQSTAELGRGRVVGQDALRIPFQLGTLFTRLWPASAANICTEDLPPIEMQSPLSRWSKILVRSPTHE